MFLNSLPIAVVGSYLSFFVFGLYRGVWQYYDSRDIVRYLQAAFGAVFITAGVMAIIYYPLGISYRVFVIFVLLLIIGLIITRSSFTILDRFSTNQLREQIKEIPVLIYTANEAVVMLHQWLLQSTDQQMKIIGFHLPNGGIGRVEKTGSAYKFIGEK